MNKGYLFYKKETENNITRRRDTIKSDEEIIYF